MKRSAEKQISKDDDDADDSEQAASGFVKADEAELSSRKIRALPKRSSILASPSSPPSTPQQTPKFSGFSGFGSPAANSSSFTFAVPAPSISDSPGSKSSSFFTSATPAHDAPTLGKYANSSNEELPKHLSYNSVTQAKEDDYAAAFQFFKSIRGLNVAFTAFLAKSVEEDPFVDLAQVFDQYASKRRNIKNAWDTHPTGGPSEQDVPRGPNPSSSVSFAKNSVAHTTTIPISDMPKPPSSFAGFKLFTSGTSSETSSKGGFTPTPEPSKTSGGGFNFAFPSSSAITGPSGPPAPTFALDNSSAAKKEPQSTVPESSKSPFTFGSSSTSDLTSATKPTSYFGNGSSTNSVFGSTSPGTGPFGSSSPLKSQDTPRTSSVFGGSPFGVASSDNASTSNQFSGFGSPTNSTADKTSTFNFGRKPFAGFGNVSGGSGGGSIGNPVGFGFGSPPKTPPTASDNNSKPAFAFGNGITIASASTSSNAEGNAGEKAGEDVEEVDHAKVLSPVSIHDQEGEGEENEETTYSVKCKVYKMSKTEGTAGWADMGIGLLRVKKNKETNSRRVLLRNSSSGKLVINFNLHPGMNPGTNNQSVSFMGHDDQGTPTPFRLRLKTESAAADLKAALDREIEFVKGKSD